MKAHLNKVFAGVLVAVYLSSMILTGAVLATPQQMGTAQPPVGQEPQRGVNPETGRVSFIGAGNPIRVPGVSSATEMTPQDRAIRFATVYGREFGLQNPALELKLLRSVKDRNGNDVVRYQQVFMGVPILAGEMIVSMDASGALLSISGEVSPDLTLNVNPTVPAQVAEQTSLTEIAKLHQVDVAQLSVSEPELWIFDESLLTASTRPAELVWRMEVMANDAPLPIREMVLVNAQTGGISFHVNQVDTQHASHPQALPQAIPTQIQYADLIVDEARGRLYGADKAGNKIDIISMADLSVTGSYSLGTGALPNGIDLSPTGNELAVAQSGLNQVKFINLTNGTTSELASPLPARPNGEASVATDVIYGRSGILYVFSSHGLHVVNIAVTPHAEDPAQYVAEEWYYRDERYGAISADKNTLYSLAGSTWSVDNLLYKYDVSAGVVSPTLLGMAHVNGTQSKKGIRLSLIDDSSILTTSGVVYNAADLTLKAKNGQGAFNYLYPSLGLPSRSYYVTAYDNPSGTDLLYFFDKQNSYVTSVLNAGSSGTPGAIAATSNGSTLFVSSTSGMTKFTLGATPPGTAASLPETTRQYMDFVFDMPRGVIYGTDYSNRVDVISQSTGMITNSYLLPNGAAPQGIDLSPSGNELAIALSGLEKILFLDPVTGAQIAEVTPQLPPLWENDDYDNVPFDVIYGRTGRLYSTGNATNMDYMHMFDTATHTWITRFEFQNAVIKQAELAITSDKRYLYANEPRASVYIHGFDVQTDTITKPYESSASLEDAISFTISPDGTKVFTSYGHVLSGDLQTLLGTLEGGPGYHGVWIKYIPGKNAVAYTRTDPLTNIMMKTITFASTVDYHLISTYTMPYDDGYIREMEVAPDGSKMIVNYGGGTATGKILIINLSTFPPPSPATPTPVPTTTADPTNLTGSRKTYTAAGIPLPGALLCTQSQVVCTNGADPDADHAHQYAADTYAFYKTHHGRDSFDNRGGTLISSVRYGTGYQNAFWDGSQIAYGDGMAADDVVAHEFTHGVTQYSSNLIYSDQPGAISESLSDIWGEFVDQTNGLGNDSAAVKWLIGEDTPVTALRSMSDPTIYGHPDKMSSPYYYYGGADNGGVHYNNGVNNKAVFLMTEGGTFNGRTVTGIGLDKTVAIYYEVQVNLLTAGSNYNDLYYALLQACQNLIGSNGITQSNCNQVKTAAEAVEMVSTALPPTSTPTNTYTVTPTATLPPGSPDQSIYLSLTGSQTIAGVASADEDILRFDGANWSLYFDGSDVGVGSSDLVAFSMLDGDSLLMSFNTNVTVNGIAATPQDVLRFDATLLGSTTAGTFSLYFDGSDVGLDNATSEKIDALSLLMPGERLLISTTGNPSVPNLATGRDEDMLLFVPNTYGDMTSGYWSIYFDGSDVGLSETSGEDIDAFDVVDSNVYLSTLENFSVTGLSGADEDVFGCAAASFGGVTVCDYSSSLYFDGSAWGLVSNDVDAIHYPKHEWLTTPVPPVTQTPTRTLTPVMTVSPDNTFLFAPDADARVSEASPTTNYGSATTLLVDTGAGAAETSYLRFDTRELSGSILNAKLLVYCTTNGTTNGPAAYLANNSWTEATVNWNTQPALLSGAADNKGAIAAGSWVEYDVTALMTGTGIHTFALVGDGTDGVTFSSREGVTSPMLLITLGASGPTSTPTRTPTRTPTPTATTVGPSATQTGNTSTFTAIADAYVNAGSLTSNYGSASTLRVDASPDVHSYLRFNVQGLSGTVTQATLRLYANSASSIGCTANSVANNTWSEAALTYNNAPPVGGALGSSGPFGASAWIEIDVTAYITGNGTYNLGLTTSSSTAVSFNSRESGNDPQLVIETTP